MQPQLSSPCTKINVEKYLIHLGIGRVKIQGIRPAVQRSRQ